MKRVGVIGAGKWGMNHIRIYKTLLHEVEFVGISDIDQEKKSIADKLEIAFFHDYSDLVKNVDAVSIVAPTNIHYKLVRECLTKNTHVLVEKPLVFTSKEAEELVKLAKDKSLVLHVGYLFRFNPVVPKLKELLPSIGEIRAVNARYIQPNKQRNDSGVVFNLSVHLVDILNFILPQKPTKVLCKKTNKLDINFEDSATIILRYDKFHAALELSCEHPEKQRDMFILGTKGALYADFKEQILIKYTAPQISGDEWKSEFISIEKKEPLREEIINFLKSLENEEARKLGEEEIYTTRICEKALESANSELELEI